MHSFSFPIRRQRRQGRPRSQATWLSLQTAHGRFCLGFSAAPGVAAPAPPSATKSEPLDEPSSLPPVCGLLSPLLPESGDVPFWPRESGESTAMDSLLTDDAL